MTVTIRPIADAPSTYLAYTVDASNQAMYLVYFTESIWGILTLHNFVQMLQRYFEDWEVDLSYRNTDFQLNTLMINSILDSEAC